MKYEIRAQKWAEISLNVNFTGKCQSECTKMEGDFVLTQLKNYAIITASYVFVTNLKPFGFLMSFDTDTKQNEI